jgi:transposase-like protein
VQGVLKRERITHPLVTAILGRLLGAPGEGDRGRPGKGRLTSLQAGSSYRAIARRHNVSKDALARHRATHMSRHTETGLTAAKKIITLLNEAERSPSWNSAVLAIRKTRHYVEELLTLNLTVPASRAVEPDPSAK